MGKRVRISNEILNAYGTWIVTAGCDTAQYERNPVLLYMHVRGDVIGYIKDIKVENDEVTGEPVFDEASELSIRAKKQFEFGSLRMVSAGIEILEMSEDPKLLKPGQTRPTITKSRLIEVSIVDIGANDDALVLTQNGVRLQLGKDGSNPLPLLNNKPSNPSKQMLDLKELALMVGLEATADESAVKARILALKKAEEDNKTLRSEKEQMTLSAITQAVDAGIAENKIPADKKDHFINLGKTAGLEALKETIAAMSPKGKISQVLTHTPKPQGEATFTKLSEVPAEKLMAMRKGDRETYIKLFKAEYGFEPTFDEE
jgi:hypothetical protein